MAFFDISEIFTRQGVKRKPGVMRPIFPTAAQETRLTRYYVSVVNVWSEAAATRILPAYARTLSGMVGDTVQDIQYEIAETEGFIVRAILTFRAQFEAALNDFSMWHFKRFVANLKYVTNVDLSTIVDPNVGETLESIMARNVALVRSVSDQTRERIQDIVYRNLQNRTPVREVAKEIAEATGLSRARARRIASDQLVKTSAALDESRMRDIGIDKFKWFHSGKRHFRPHHKARDGKTYAWDDPEIKNDKPGYAPFCGCKAQGVIGDD